MIDKWLVIAGLLLNDFGLSVTPQTHHHSFAQLADAQDYMNLARLDNEFPVLFNIEANPLIEEQVVRMEDRARGGTWMMLQEPEAETVPMPMSLPIHPPLRVPK